MSTAAQMSNASLTTDMETITSGKDGAVNCRIVSRPFAYIPWHNTDNIITLETVYLIAKIMDGIVSPVMAFMGLPLNIVNCLVFFRQGLGDRINLLLFCQALADFLVEMTVSLHSAEYFYSLLVGSFQVYGPWMRFKQNNGINTMYGFVYVSALISTMIACERCLCVTYPFQARKLFRSSTTAVVVAAAAVTLVGSHYIISDKYRIGCIRYTQLNLTVTGYIPSQFYLQHRKQVDVLNGVMFGLGLPCVFFSVTILATVVTTVKLRTAAAWRQRACSSATQEQGAEVGLTKMLIAVSCLFLVCTLPGIVVKLMPVFVADFNLGGRYQNLFMGCIGLIHVSPAVNSSLNFFFYLRMGSKFRLTLKQLCCCEAGKTLAGKGSVIPTQAVP